MTKENNIITAKVNADKARIDRLKKQLRDTDPEVDFERVRIMQKVYDETAGDPQIMRGPSYWLQYWSRRSSTSTTTSSWAAWQVA